MCLRNIASLDFYGCKSERLERAKSRTKRRVELDVDVNLETTSRGVTISLDVGLGWRFFWLSICDFVS
jgi:hypothetical protein